MTRSDGFCCWLLVLLVGGRAREKPERLPERRIRPVLWLFIHALHLPRRTNSRERDRDQLLIRWSASGIYSSPFLYVYNKNILMMMALPGKQQQMGLLFREERRTIDGVIEWRGVSLIYRPPLRPWLWSHLVHLLRNIEPSSVALERIFSLEVKQFYASMNPLIVTKKWKCCSFFLSLQNRTYL